MALQLIDLGQEVEYIDIDTAKVPYTFSVKLTDKTYMFTIKYNEVGKFFIDTMKLVGRRICTSTASSSKADRQTRRRSAQALPSFKSIRK